MKILACLWFGHSAPVAAQDDAFQSFLNDACTSPQAELASRCGETFAGQGGISPGSQTSLNPNQALAGPNSASSLARERVKESRSRQDRRLDEEQVEGPQIEFGRLSLLLNGRRISQNFDAGSESSSERSYDLTDNNLEAGLDYRLSDRAVIGAWFEWRDSDLQFGLAAPVETLAPDFDAGRIDSESRGGAIFTGFDLTESVHLDVAAGFSDTDYRVERRGVFEPLQAGDQPGPVTVVDTRARTTGNDTWATLNLGYRIESESWSFDPFIGATWSRADVAAYVEEDLLDTGLAMSIGEVEADSLTGVLGFDARKIVSLSSAVLIPQFHFEYGYGIDTDANEALATFLLDPDAENRLAMSADEPDRDFARAGIGVVAILQGGWSFFLDVQSTIGVRHVDRYAIAAGVRLEL